VLRPDGSPIAGLYAAGRATSALAVSGYCSGISLGDCSFFGRRAGQSAASAELMATRLKESAGEHDQGGPPVPRGPAADLVLVQAGRPGPYRPGNSLLRSHPRPATFTKVPSGTCCGA
jgi:succinate dehydrogenase/fumarate reductase flavoprotein subunit